MNCNIERSKTLTVDEKYNEICKAAMIKCYTKAKDVMEVAIPIKDFDINNYDHHFILSIAKNLSGIFSVQVAVDTTRRNRRKLNKSIKIKGAKLIPYKSEYDAHAIIPEEIFAELKPLVNELFTDDYFGFRDIYHLFYEV